MPVADTRIVGMDLVAKLLLQRFDELCGLFGRDLIRAMVENTLVFIRIRVLGESDGINTGKPFRPASYRYPC